MEPSQLAVIARQAQENAYSPYSGLKVGAALITNRGNIYTGANVENASYGLSICAERLAVFQAILNGDRGLDTLAVVSSSPGYIYPCGACLQVLAEFAPDIKVVVANENQEIREYYLNELLPQAFTLR